MNVIVTIDGKEAIPVRAIPLLTDWRFLSPDLCARIFSGEDTWQDFKEVVTHRLNPDSSYQVIAQREWANWIVPRLAACSDSIPEDSQGRLQWRKEALKLLPSGAFVWRETFEAAYQREYGPDSMYARNNHDTFKPSDAALNYTPQHGPQENWRELVMEGFGAMQQVQSPESKAAPVIKRKAKPLSWWDVSSTYIAGVIQAGQYATAKELYRALEAKAGMNSPFDKGTGANRGNLFVREIAQSLSLKTVQNKWSKLQELAKK